MIAAITLWHSAGISCSSGGSGSCNTSVACVHVCVVRVASIVIEASVFGSGSMLLTVLLSRVMRLSCRVSDFVMGGVVLCLYRFEVVGLLAILSGLGRGSCLWFPPPFLPLCLFGLW